MHFLKVLVPSHKSNEDLFECTNLFHVLGEAKEAYFRLVEVTILEDDASRSYMKNLLEINLNVMHTYVKKARYNFIFRTLE